MLKLLKAKERLQSMLLTLWLVIKMRVILRLIKSVFASTSAYTERILQGLKSVRLTHFCCNFRLRSPANWRICF